MGLLQFTLSPQNPSLRESERKLKLGRNLDIGIDAEAMEEYWILAISLMVVHPAQL